MLICSANQSTSRFTVVQQVGTAACMQTSRVGVLVCSRFLIHKELIFVLGLDFIFKS